MDSADRAAIVAAAVVAAGPPDGNRDDWLEQVEAEARQIFILAGVRGRIGRVVEQMGNSRTFARVITRVEKEQSSQWGLVTLSVEPTQYSKDGVEQVRTERMDGQFAEQAKAMGRTLRDELMGHRVLLWVETETDDDATPRGRVIRHVVDLGLPYTRPEPNS